VVARTASRTSASTAPAAIAQLRGAADQLAAEAEISLAGVHQVVVGTPGVIWPGEDHLSLAPNLPGWAVPGVIRDIRRALVAPVLFENDINLAAVGEHVQGVARGVDDFVLLSIGTGVGMGVVLDGELRRGAAGLAGEIGYLALDMDAAASGRVAAWGAGAFEALTSAAGILALARAAGLSDADSAADVFAAARSGEAAAAAVVAIEARRLAHAIAAIAAVLDPHLVVLGGGIGTGGGDLLLGPVAEALAAISPFSPQLAISGLGADGVIAGAAATGLRLALDRIFERAAMSAQPFQLVGMTQEAQP
jgi:predicted NBD/HSP70 family sugar kinase